MSIYKNVLSVNEVYDLTVNKLYPEYNTLLDNELELYGWGANCVTLVGDNTTVHRSSPVQIPGTSWSILGNSLAIKSDKTLWSWGRTVGDNTIIHRSSPVQIPGYWSGLIPNTKKVFKSDNTLWTWGLNTTGYLGDGSKTSRSSPVQIPGQWSNNINNRSSIGAFKTDGTLWVWGSNYFSGLGTNNITPLSSPIQLPGDWCAIAAGGPTFALKTNGTLWAWGRNNYGQTGDNTTVHRSSPVQIPGTQWTKVGGGGGSAGQGFALKSDSTLWAWGQNYSGGLGNSSRVPSSSPIQIPGTQWNDIFGGGGSSRTFARKTDGTLWAWGNNGPIGALGLGDLIARCSPAQIPGVWVCVAGGGDTNWGLK